MGFSKFSEITAKIGQLQQLNPSEVVQAAQEVRRLLADIEELLEQMELSVREIPSSRFFPSENYRTRIFEKKFSPERAKYETRVKSYRSDKRQLDAELRKVRKFAKNFTF